MDTRTRLSHNIRCLRVAYGETQEQLADILGLESKSAISQYETASREPDRDMLSKLAKHYLVSVEELMSNDFSGLGKIAVDPHIFWENINVIFPIALTDDALKNEQFRKAHAAHCAFFDGLKQNSFEGFERMLDHVAGYLAAYDNNVTKEVAAANLFGLWLLAILILRQTPTLINDKPAVLRQLMKNDRKIETTVEYSDPSLKKDFDDILKELDTPEINEKMSEFMLTIKKSHKWGELADYYLALQYCWGLVDNELSREYNARIGVEMLTAFISVGNRYAARFLMFQINISFESKSAQTVDDRLLHIH